VAFHRLHPRDHPGFPRFDFPAIPLRLAIELIFSFRVLAHNVKISRRVPVMDNHTDLVIFYTLDKSNQADYYPVGWIDWLDDADDGKTGIAKIGESTFYLNVYANFCRFYGLPNYLLLCVF